ncbi:lipoprotein-releasing ABC transporter permease subunit [Otariodibacter oris]|uniref:Lipoprotein-releasing system permease protein n=1 Tax=Otariodibacter oris TaxID=1032623 RepID=A0A420XGT8_9PAST|nr:lipoprotein-releasing ABC transporter permease subunit [Otariodibacter oris]QGM81203.1 permease [Otariodibacter oris]RKR72763.1 lipoprotein-releasing system permease protein [Otariodibacter oris]
MSLNISLFIAFRYWRSKSGDRFGRLVTNLASLGIVLGVMALIIVLSVMNGLEGTQKRNLLSTLPHAIISPLEKEDAQPTIFPDFVEKAVAINRTNMVIQSQQGINAGELIGVENSQDDPLLARLSDLNDVLPEGEFNVVVSSLLAEQLNLKIGDKIRLMITENSQYTPFGRVPVQRLFTISDFYFGNSDSSHTLFANLRDVGRLLRLDSEHVQGTRVFLTDPFLVTELVNYFPENKWKISDWREQKGEFFQAVKMEKNMMGLLVSLIIIVAISNIVTSLSLMVVDKQGEIAILQTQGLTKRQVTQIFISQGLLVGIIGAIVGGLLGVLIANNLSDVLQMMLPVGVMLPTEIIPQQVAIIILISIGLSLICTLYPAYRAAKIEPAEALRYE